MLHSALSLNDLNHSSLIESRHEKTCFMPHANSKGADHCIHSTIPIQSFKTLASLCSLAG